MGHRAVRDTDRQAITRLGFTFHRTFSLNRSAVSDILKSAWRANPMTGKTVGLTQSMIRNLTNLGTIYVESMPRYGFGAGLLDSKNCLTPFGALAQQHDPLLDQVSTQWLMHYHLSAPHGPGPAFWHELVATRFRIGSDFTRADLCEQIARFYEQAEGKPLAERSARTSVTIFLGTYLKADGLGRLRLIWEDSEGRLHAREPEAPSTWVFACALVDYWRAHFPDRLTINLDTLTAPRGLADLFMIGSGQLNRLLREIQDAGHINVYRVAPPYQVVLLHQDTGPLLGRMYGVNDSG